MSDDARIAAISEALDYYFIPGEHHDRPNLEGHAALAAVAAELAEKTDALNRIALASSTWEGIIARAALSRGATP